MLRKKLLRAYGHLGWLRFGVRDRLIRLCHNPDQCGDESFAVPFYGAQYSGNFDTYLDWCVYYYGAYAKEELRLFADFLSTISHPIVLDIGANIGHHSLFAAMHSEHVYAFEPFPDVAEKLKSKACDNRLTNVTLFEFALGDRNQCATYFKPNTHNTGTGSFAIQGDRGETLSLPIRIGDEVMEEHNIKTVDFIKIDTEGYEPFVLKGLAKTLKSSRPLVFFEWTQEGRQSTQRECQTSFPEGYSFFEFVADTNYLGILRKATYRLSPLNPSSPWPDGNLFAVPNEQIARLQSEYPDSRAARQVGAP